MRSLLGLRLLNAIGFALVILMNVLANSLPINGYTTGELSDLYPNLFVPAGFTFSIWGLIYLALALFVAYQFRDWGESGHSPALTRAVGPWFFISCMFNASWILAWHHLLVLLSLLIMLGLLISLAIIYRRIGIGQQSASDAAQFWMGFVPFSLYLGWITVATIANVTTLLVDIGWSGGPVSPIGWTSVMIMTAALVGLYFLFRRKDLIYAGVLLWAFYGIYAKRTAEGDAFSIIIWTLIIAGLLLLIGVVINARAWLGRWNGNVSSAVH